MKKVFIEGALGDVVTLSKEDSHHLLRVLRFDKEKQELTIASPFGEKGAYRFRAMEGDESLWELVGTIEKDDQESPLVLVQSYLKGEKFEWVLQKATELGATTIIGLPTAHSVVKYDAKKVVQKKVRWKKIMEEASQQCGRSHLPTLELYGSLEAFLDTYRGVALWCLVAYEGEQDRSLRTYVREGRDLSQGQLLLIGPEGGLAPSEVKRLVDEGFSVISLGARILRAETAALMGLSILQYEREGGERP